MGNKKLNTRLYYQFSILILILCGQSSSTTAQEKLLRPLNIQADNHYISFHINYIKEDITPNDILTYYWYKNNTIFENVGGFSGQLLQGRFEKYTFSGKLIEKGTFTDGVKDGTWKEWDMNGKLTAITHWSKGKKDGLAWEFNPNSNKKTEHNYKGNILHGWVKEYKQDSLINKTKYRKGKVKRKGFLFF